MRYIIVMPLTALIRDATKKLEGLLPQLPCVHLTAATLEEAKSATFIFTSPEVLIGAGRKLLQDVEFSQSVKAVFIDEFHVVKLWGTKTKDSKEKKGKAFRSQYGQLGELRAFFGRHVPFVCMSATADKETMETAEEILRLDSPNIIQVDVNKRNITYHRVKVSGAPIADLSWVVKCLEQPITPRMLIFFTNSNHLTDAYQSILYHSGEPIGGRVAMFQLVTNDQLKAELMADLGNPDGKTKVVLCTSSLSMGINLAAIDYVIHYGLPHTTDMFLQETGRSSREDGSHGHSIILTYPRMMAGRANTTDNVIKQLAKTGDCLRDTLLSKFDAVKPSDQSQCCTNCGVEADDIIDLICDDLDSEVSHNSISSYDSDVACAADVELI